MDNAESVRREVAEYRDLTPAQRWSLVKQACRATPRLLKLNVNPQAALDWRDPLPESSLKLLARLRTEYRAKRG